MTIHSSDIFSITNVFDISLLSELAGIETTFSVKCQRLIFFQPVDDQLDFYFNESGDLQILSKHDAGIHYCSPTKRALETITSLLGIPDDFIAYMTYHDKRIRRFLQRVVALIENPPIPTTEITWEQLRASAICA